MTTIWNRINDILQHLENPIVTEDAVTGLLRIEGVTKTRNVNMLMSQQFRLEYFYPIRIEGVPIKYRIELLME